MNYQAIADSYAEQYGIRPELFRGLIQQESGWNPSARSPAGAYGLTQAMPATARDPGFGVAPLKDVGNPNEQLRFGAEYLDAMLDRYGGNEQRALAAYNAGPGVADKWSGEGLGGLPGETQGYIPAVLGFAGGGAGVGLSMGEPAEPAEAAEPPYDPDWLDRLAGRFGESEIGEAIGYDPAGMRRGGAARTGIGNALMTFGTGMLEG